MTSTETVPVYPVGRYRVSPNRGFQVLYWLTMVVAPPVGVVSWRLSLLSLSIFAGAVLVTVFAIAPLMWVTKTPPHTKEF